MRKGPLELSVTEVRKKKDKDSNPAPQGNNLWQKAPTQTVIHPLDLIQNFRNFSWLLISLLEHNRIRQSYHLLLSWLWGSSSEQWNSWGSSKFQPVGLPDLVFTKFDTEEDTYQTQVLLQREPQSQSYTTTYLRMDMNYTSQSIIDLVSNERLKGKGFFYAAVIWRLPCKH